MRPSDPRSPPGPERRDYPPLPGESTARRRAGGRRTKPFREREPRSSSLGGPAEPGCRDRLMPQPASEAGSSLLLALRSRRRLRLEGGSGARWSRPRASRRCCATPQHEGCGGVFHCHSGAAQRSPEPINADTASRPSRPSEHVSGYGFRARLRAIRNDSGGAGAPLPHTLRPHPEELRSSVSKEASREHRKRPRASRRALRPSSARGLRGGAE